MIKHDGIVIALEDNGMVRVRILQTSACASCKAKAMCASAESKEKEILALFVGEEAKRREGERQDIKLGDEVVVMVQQKMGWKAILLAYMLPFVVMMAVVAIGNGLLGMREEVIGTLALCAMGVYYIVLGFFKDKIQKEFSFTARKK
jgi:sigma-E factor negative regulatory protein RseC